MFLWYSLCVASFGLFLLCILFWMSFGRWSVRSIIYCIIFDGVPEALLIFPVTSFYSCSILLLSYLSVHFYFINFISSFLLYCYRVTFLLSFFPHTHIFSHVDLLCLAFTSSVTLRTHFFNFSYFSLTCHVSSSHSSCCSSMIFQVKPYSLAFPFSKWILLPTLSFFLSWIV